MLLWVCSVIDHSSRQHVAIVSEDKCMSIYCYRTSPALGALHCLRRASNVCLALSTVPADTLKRKKKTKDKP